MGCSLGLWWCWLKLSFCKSDQWSIRFLFIYSSLIYCTCGEEIVPGCSIRKSVSCSKTGFLSVPFVLGLTAESINVHLFSQTSISYVFVITEAGSRELLTSTQRKTHNMKQWLKQCFLLKKKMCFLHPVFTLWFISNHSPECATVSADGWMVLPSDALSHDSNFFHFTGVSRLELYVLRCGSSPCRCHSLGKVKVKEVHSFMWHCNYHA